IDVRIITATNKDLKKEIEQGNFREDLFYRLNVVPITIPPLRERREDIIPLALTFIQYFNHELHRSFKEISEDAAKVLLAHDWPGNVRELKNVIERIMALNQSEEILLEHLPLEIKSSKSTFPILKESVEKTEFISLNELEKKYIKEVLKFTGGNKSKAAKILGIHLTSLFRKLKSL
ncbi:sigma-54-dependent Fis family transcriptional regulator, partial [candidate division WOR-3 bacterium]|nr:sigma-54-dependent Fis family transcriptional regulator [candidate division WOR-3 bacterium]